MSRQIGMGRRRRNFWILCLFIIIIILGSAIGQPESTDSVNSTSTGLENKMNTRARASAQTHTVFAEYFTTGWCVYCPSASSNLKSIYDSKDYDFYFVSMILEDQDSNLISQDARDRADEFGISSFPTVEFEGGYYEVVGGQSDENNYRNAIDACIDREVPDIDIELTAKHKGDAVIEISTDITNSDASSYSGTLRIYIVEIVSRYLNYDGDYSSYGFLDFALVKDITIQSGNVANEVTTWDGAQVTDELGNDFSDIQPDNIIVFATMSNGDRATAMERHQESAMALNLYFIDEAAAAYLTEGAEDDTKEPEIEILEPSPFDELSGTIRLEARITDEGTVPNVDYDIDDNGIWTRMYPLGPGDDEYFAFWDTELVEDCMHTITVRAIDLGNNKGMESVEVNVANYANDQTKPVIEFEDLEEEQKIMDSFSFTVEVTDDSDIERVSYKIDDNSWKNMEQRGFNRYTATINTTEFIDGIHTLTISARDRAGNTETQSITVQISNKPSKKSAATGFLPGFEASIMLAILGLVVMYLSRGSKKK
ncbi:Ig-like domain-containing protein [[Eubacterium] cellulosolvens]